MSAPVLDSARAPIDLPVAEQATGLNFLAVVRRRWPWVLVGLFIGVVGGLLAYSTRPAVFQSNAQVLVVKKKAEIGSASDMRTSNMEDYISTQATILKSETVLSNAAKRIPNDLRVPLPNENAERVKILANMFSVAREKDPNNPNVMNNVLNISMKGSNADDCQKILDVIIEAYKDELRGIYDEVTKDRLELLNQVISSNVEKVKSNKEAIDKTNAEIRKITQEDASVLQLRFSKETEMKRQMQNEVDELRGYKAMIEKVGPDKKDRALLLQRLSTLGRNQSIAQSNSLIDPRDMKYLWQELEAQYEEWSNRLGPDHPNMIQIKKKIDFYKKLYADSNPGDPEGKLDGLAQYEMYLKGRIDISEQIINNMMGEINSDNQKITQVIPLKESVDYLQKINESRTKLIDGFESERTNTDLTRLSGGFQCKTLNQPSRELTPIAPKLSQSLLLGMAVGLLFGVGLAALAELSDKGFRSPADIRSRLGLPVIGHIPPIRTNLPLEENLDLEPTLVSAVRPKSVEAEAYRGVRTALYFNAAGSTHQMIQVTSPNQGDGKSTLAANLAVSIAQSGKRVLLVDCDMRRPRVHKVFRLPDPGPGLAAVINGTAPLSAAIQRSVVENLSLLPCGKKPANPAELLTSPNFGDLLDRLKSDYDYVVLDTPPVLAVSDPSAVAPRADGVILVFRMTSKVRPAAERAREQLTQIGANVIGVVVNGSGRGSGDAYGYGGYAYGSEYTGYSHQGQYMDNYDQSDEDDTPPKKG